MRPTRNLTRPPTSPSVVRGNVTANRRTSATVTIRRNLRRSGGLSSSLGDRLRTFRADHVHERSAVVEQRPSQVLGPVTLLPSRELASSLAKPGRQAIADHRMALFAKHHGHQGVGFLYRVFRRIHESLLDSLPSRHVSAPSFRR